MTGEYFASHADTSSQERWNKTIAQFRTINWQKLWTNLIIQAQSTQRETDERNSYPAANVLLWALISTQDKSDRWPFNPPGGTYMPTVQPVYIDSSKKQSLGACTNQLT